MNCSTDTGWSTNTAASISSARRANVSGVVVPATATTLASRVGSAMTSLAHSVRMTPPVKGWNPGVATVRGRWASSCG
jgi:hypothetical protein